MVNVVKFGTLIGDSSLILCTTKVHVSYWSTNFDHQHVKVVGVFTNVTFDLYTWYSKLRYHFVSEINEILLVMLANRISLCNVCTVNVCSMFDMTVDWHAFFGRQKQAPWRQVSKSLQMSTQSLCKVVQTKMSETLLCREDAYLNSFYVSY